MLSKKQSKLSEVSVFFFFVNFTSRLLTNFYVIELLCKTCYDTSAYKNKRNVGS